VLLGADAAIPAAPDHAVIAGLGFAPADPRAVALWGYDPVYLLPMVELRGDRAPVARAAALMAGLGMEPLTAPAVTPPVAATLAAAITDASDRLRAAGLSPVDIDRALATGPALVWAQGGLGPDAPGRDVDLVAMLRALARTGRGAGAAIAAHEARQTLPETGPDGLPVTAAMQVPTSFVDYNGHMNEAPYLAVSAQASDRFMEMIGADAAYIAAGRSYFTAENHIRYFSEIAIGAAITVTTQALGGDGRKLHLLNRIWAGGDGPAASVETLLLHVDLTTRRVVAPDAALGARMAALVTAHAAHPRPDRLSVRL
jgi:carnitine 3-dehydrogenase